MIEDGGYGIFVSEDFGQSFSKTNSFIPQNGSLNSYISGLAASYIDKNRAYVLFSGQGKAKVLKTEDLGQTWEDISGFSTGANTGFPDVAIHSILEMPFDKDILWAGTDIGIFETENGGTTWSLLTDFPSVAVYEMKVSNDQVVIATHGRGVWSATISELENFTFNSFLALPSVTTEQKAIESVKTIVSYTVPSDDVSKVKLFVDGTEVTEIVQDFSEGVTYTYETDNLSEGYHNLGVQLFDETNNLETPVSTQEFLVIDFDNAASSIGIAEFEPSDVFVYKSDFIIDKMLFQVSDKVLNNADHPYLSNKTYSVVLKKPLTISGANKNFSYEDMAIVEPYPVSNDLTNFYDYVIIEASKDLQNWTTLDKYDARRFPEWLAEYNKGAAAAPSNELFKEQTIDLTANGELGIGDTVVIRFRLVTDVDTTSFGWAIRSVNKATASIKEVLNNTKVFTMYPTVSSGDFTLFAKKHIRKSNPSII
jgi:hypothetical protein